MSAYWYIGFSLSSTNRAFTKKQHERSGMVVYEFGTGSNIDLAMRYTTDAIGERLVIHHLVIKMDGKVKDTIPLNQTFHSPTDSTIYSFSSDNFSPGKYTFEIFYTLGNDKRTWEMNAIIYQYDLELYTPPDLLLPPTSSTLPFGRRVSQKVVDKLYKSLKEGKLK